MELGENNKEAAIARTNMLMHDVRVWLTHPTSGKAAITLGLTVLVMGYIGGIMLSLTSYA
jgi:hypothetical protein